LLIYSQQWIVTSLLRHIYVLFILPAFNGFIVVRRLTQLGDFDWFQQVCLTSWCITHGFYHEATLRRRQISADNNNIV